MDFRPQHERHAIHEVVFVINFARDLNPGEIQAVVDQHDRWREQLPKLERTEGAKLALKAGNNPMSLDVQELEKSSFQGARFEAIKRDGTLDWRLSIQEDWISINCLTYTRWDNVWPTARELMTQATKIVVNENLPISSLALQYIDQFSWTGPQEQYDIAELLKLDGNYMPDRLKNCGPLWHVHQGWFVNNELGIPGRRLEKIHADSTMRADQFVVRIDTTLRHDLSEHYSSFQSAFDAGPDDAPVNIMFEELHNRSKQILSELLTDEMAGIISLDE